MLWLNYTKGSPTVRSRNYYPVTSKEKSSGLTCRKCWESNRDGSGSWSNVINKVPLFLHQLRSAESHAGDLSCHRKEHSQRTFHRKKAHCGQTRASALVQLQLYQRSFGNRLRSESVCSHHHRPGQEERILLKKTTTACPRPGGINPLYRSIDST